MPISSFMQRVFVEHDLEKVNFKLALKAREKEFLLTIPHLLGLLKE